MQHNQLNKNSLQYGSNTKKTKSFTYPLVQMVAVSLALFIRAVLQRLTRFQEKQRVARSLCGS